mmetsp:Transcript_6552/g.19819  ORF Transcript_6552/g.19819 Transcript_6552/m.19819 type:complete len:243 (+) Transcript_6552:106-834(+)
MLAGPVLLQHLHAPGAEVRLAGVAPHVVVPALPDDDGLAARALTRLLPELRGVHEVREEARLVRPGLRAVHRPGLLVPAADLLVVEEAALAGGEVVVAGDLLAATPAEVDLAVLAEHLAAALRLLDGRAAARARLRGPREVPQRQQLRARRLGLGAPAGGTGLQGVEAVVLRGALRAGVVHPFASAAEDEAAGAAACHVVLVLNASGTLAVAISVAPWAVDHVPHLLQALSQTKLLPTRQGL